MNKKQKIYLLKGEMFLKIIFFFLFVFTSPAMFAGGSFSIRYCANFEMKDGKAVQGYFTHTFEGIEDTIKTSFTNAELLHFIEKIAYNDSLTIYKRIQKLKYPPTNYEEYPYFETVIDKDIIQLTIKEIKNSTFISYTKIPVYPVGGIIDSQLTQEEIDQLQSPPIAYYSLGISRENVGWEVEVLSYNKAITKEKLEELSKLVEGFISENGDENYEFFDKVKTRLNKQQIICFWHFEGD